MISARVHRFRWSPATTNFHRDPSLCIPVGRPVSTGIANCCGGPWKLRTFRFTNSNGGTSISQTGRSTASAISPSNRFGNDVSGNWTAGVLNSNRTSISVCRLFQRNLSVPPRRLWHVKHSEGCLNRIIADTTDRKTRSIEQAVGSNKTVAAP